MSAGPSGARHGAGSPVALLLAVVGALVAAPAAPATAGSCDGVWVVVDARELGAGIQTRCAPGDPSNGLDALQRAGFTYTFVERQPGMVCTIDDRPDPCNGAPADAYWSYWHAPAGGDWTYSSRGAGSRDPKPGTVEGWAFGAGDEPGTAPPANDAGSGDDGDDGDGGDGGGGSGGSDVATDDGGAPGDAAGSSTGSGGGSSDPPSSSPPAASGTDEGGDGEGPPSAPDDDDAGGDAEDGDDPDEAEPDDDGVGAGAPEPLDRTDQVAAGAGGAVVLDGGPDSGGRDVTGLAIGGTLITAIAGAAALRARRRVGPEG